MPILKGLLFICLLPAGPRALANEDRCAEGLLQGTSAERSIPENSTLILAANRLPVSVQFDGDSITTTTAEGGLVSAVSSTSEPFKWLGWPGREVSDKLKPDVFEALSNMESRFDLHPVFLSKSERELYYNQYSNRVIWPVFHGLKGFVPGGERGWTAYRKINERFARELLVSVEKSAAQSDDRVLVWIHDYHLLLAPKLLKEAIRKIGLESKVRIGFFLHIPFPDLNEFSRIPAAQRIALLDGVLGADLIGFHTPRDVEDFRAAVESSNLRFAQPVGEYPIGINPAAIDAIRETPGTKELIASLSERYKSYSVIVGIERLDPIKGIPEKLLGYERFLERNPDFRGRTVLLQILQPSRIDIPEYKRLHERVRLIANRINLRFKAEGRFPPVELVEKGINTSEVIAHLSIADAVFINSLRDGMNLVAFESEAAQKSRSQPAPLILSRNTGASQFLSGALKVDPRNRNELARAIRLALDMSAEHRLSRNRENLAHVESGTSVEWMRRFLRDLAAAPR